MKTIADALFTTESTRARSAKAAALGEALASVAAREPARLPFVARFLIGALLPTADDRALGVGGALVFEAACAVTGAAPPDLGAKARRAGDLGTAVGDAVAAAGREPPGLRLEDAEQLALTLAAAPSRADKRAALERALERCRPLEARYLVRAVLGEMRIGAREGIVEEAIARAFGRPLAEVRKAAALVTDVGELARLAHEDRLAEARVVLGRPIGFMLAAPLEAARGADLTVPHAVEDKIDGIRAQAHISPAGVCLFARGKGSVTAAFPDITGPLTSAAARGELESAIVDGEIVVVNEAGRPRPFSALQPRLKKTAPSEALMRERPVRLLVYDLMFEGDEALLALPFLERRARLVSWARSAPLPVLVHGSRPLVTPPPTGDAEADARAIERVLEAEFDTARSHGFEGLVLKRLDAIYAPGVRGFAWLKVKRALATLDVVVVAAERGHGKRAGVLSDYTFAVREGDELRTIGKAYSGLTDAEIAALTKRLEELALAEEARGYLPVRPEIVLEVAFDGVQRSKRHASGFALRFPRIVRVRDDKAPDQADTLDVVRALYEEQLATGHREDLVAGERRPPKAGRARGSGGDRAKTRQLRLFDED